MHYSSISRRFLAMLLDWAIILIPVAIAAHLIPIVGGIIFVFFYYPVFESSRLQATIGKNLMGIEVVSPAGGRISFRAGCARLLMKLLSMAFFCLGHALALFTERKQSLHDLVADTVVVYGRREVSMADAWIEQVREVFRGKSLQQ